MTMDGIMAQQVSALRGQAELLLTRAEKQGRQKLSADEARRFDELMGEIRCLESDIERSESLRAAADRLGANTQENATMMNEPGPYRPGNGHSYLQDLIRHQTRLDHDGRAGERLMQQARAVESAPEYREQRAIDTIDGTGGFFTPPLWLTSQYVPLARAGRAFANLVTNQPLPGGTDSINIPRLLTGTATAVQPVQNQQVESVDLTDTYVNAPVRTIAGEQDVALQLIDQSPVAFDEVVFRDLIASHATSTDQQVISADGTLGTVLGVHHTPNIQTVAVGAVTLPGVYAAIANAIQLVHTKRFLPPTVIVMHPRRWGWFLTLLDTNQRPLFLPSANGLFNAAGVLESVASQQVVGQMQGLPIVTDPNVPVDFGSGQDEDPIYVLRAEDLVLWETGIRTRVLPETLGHTLTVKLQVFSYIAFSAGRYPKSVVEITGLSAPTFTGS